MTLVFPRDESTNDAIAGWVMDQIGRRAFRPYRAIGKVDADGHLVAGVVFNGYNGANVDLTAYAPGEMTRQNLRAIFRFAFLDLRCERITARTKPANQLHRPKSSRAKRKHSDNLLMRLGFVFETRAARYYGAGRDNDALVYRMLRHECRWIGQPDGRHPRTAGPQRDGRRASANEPRNGHYTNGA